MILKQHDLADKNILILGLGQTGLSCVRYCLARGAVPRVCDTRDFPPGQQDLPAEVPLHTGALDADLLCDADMIIASPGIALTTPALAKAIEAGVEVVGDIELFGREAKAPVIAITGSNGKSSVTTLVGQMAELAGRTVAVGGNIGVPALDLLDNNIELYVLELSSFQLDTTTSLKPLAATVLNVSEDHLDRYRDFDHYRDSKLSIYKHAENLVCNADDPLTFTQDPAGKVQTFGEQGDYHLIAHQGETWLAHKEQPVMALSELPLAGQHNAMNALAALALADTAGLEREACLQAIRSFTGLSHRCELVAEINGVRWINDSKATNVGATEAAIAGLGRQLTGRLFLIAGGDAKGADLSPLKVLFEQHCQGIYCFGQDAHRLADLSDKVEQVADLEQAMQRIRGQVQPGDIVLLSPACASIDMYPNYMARGDHFRSLVGEVTA